MKKAALVLAIALLSAFPTFGQSETEVYTLYRNSILDVTMRLHIATFDSADGKDVNAENCFLAAELFQQQPGVETKFWCEPGRFKK